MMDRNSEGLCRQVREVSVPCLQLLSSSQNQAAGMMSCKEVNVERHGKATNLLDWAITVTIYKLVRLYL